MTKRRLIVGLIALVGLVLLAFLPFVCISGFLRYGIIARECPDGEPTLGLEVFADDLRRGTEGTIRVWPRAHFTSGPSDEAIVGVATWTSLELGLVTASEEHPLEPDDGWELDLPVKLAKVKLPADLPDGTHTLRVRGRSPIGEASLDVPLEIYAPAKIHVITDRPLYEPGNTILFRAALFRARDTVPLDGRPGKWRVIDPRGEVLLEETVTAGEFGVAAGSFPLDQGAERGRWTIRFESGSDSQEASVQVEPFTLPRFSVEGTPDAPFYGRGRRPRIDGSVRYASSAPVQNAKVSIAWRLEGEWPPPPEWMAALPKQALSGRDGRFGLDLPEVPGDLTGRAFLSAGLTATDTAGDTVTGRFVLLLSRDALAVDAVTEYGGGLVAGFNNRMYLRATTPDGRALPKATLRVSRAWDPTDEGVEAVTDEDGVAALQIDPGPAVSVVVPALPVRAPPRPRPKVEIESMTDLVSQGSATFADQTTMERLGPELLPCARFVDGRESVVLGLKVETTGAVTFVTEGPEGSGGSDALSNCVGRILGQRRLPNGRPRALILGLAFDNRRQPMIEASVEAVSSSPDWLTSAVDVARLDARACLSGDVRSGPLSQVLRVAFSPRDGKLERTWVPDPNIAHSLATVSTRVESCVEERFGNILAERARSAAVRAREASEATEVSDGERPALAAIRLTVDARDATSIEAKDTVRLGYELSVASVGGNSDSVADTKIFLPEGSVPPLRLRAEPAIASKGGSVEVQLLRGPGFQGTLPDELLLRHVGAASAKTDPIKAKVDSKSKTARFQLPADREGWFVVESAWRAERALVFVPEEKSLDVALTPERNTYAPGDEARISILTKGRGRAMAAGVTLVGVDESLAQLATLVGPDDLAGVRSTVEVSSPAFGLFDAAIVSAGHIRGANARAAAILRVDNPPTLADLDVFVKAEGSTAFDPIEALTDSFYAVLGDVYGRVRAWETGAGPDEKLTPDLMMKFFDEVVNARRDKGEVVTDAYGRPLRLKMLPPDLLALVDPRSVVVDGRHLDEDVENWVEFVQENAK